MKVPAAVPITGKPDHLLDIQGKRELLPPLFVGEVAEAEAVEDCRSGKVLISIKGRSVLADSKVPLSRGEKIAVRVASLYPGVVLRVLGKTASESGLAGHLKSYRSNPRALSDILVEGSVLFGSDETADLLSCLDGESIGNLKNMFNSLIFSGQSLGDPFFLKNYIHVLGYLMERRLGEAVKKGLDREGHVEAASRTLKGFLLKILDDLQSPSKTKDLPAAEKLAGFVRSSIREIESHQVVNYLFQEREGAYMFQVPLLFPAAAGIAEIFVKFNDRDSEGADRRDGGDVLFLLGMDALGKIAVKVSIRSGKIGCVFECEDTESRDFVEPFMEELGRRLVSSGYVVEYLRCIVKSADAPDADYEIYSAFRDLFPAEAINLTV